MTSSTTGAVTGSATGPAVPDQRGGAAALDRLWQRHRQANLDRVVVLERAAVTVLRSRWLRPLPASPHRKMCWGTSATGTAS